jgi:hypothetical protein
MSSYRSRKHLLNAEAVQLAPLLCLIHADRKTSSSTRLAVQAALSRMWPVCLGRTVSLSSDLVRSDKQLTCQSPISLATTLCIVAQDLPAVSQRDVLYSIGVASEQTRALSRWVAVGLLCPDALLELAIVSCFTGHIAATVLELTSQNGNHVTPLLPTIEACIDIVTDELDRQKPDHTSIDHQLAFLSETMGDLNGLVEALPISDHGAPHETDHIRLLVKRADATISKSPNCCVLPIVVLSWC